MKKFFIGAGVGIMVVVIGVFVFATIQEYKRRQAADMPENKEEYVVMPTVWSQAGDYKIEETPQGMLVSNSKAGFSFAVPEGWKVEEGRGLGEDYAFVATSPGASIRSGIFVENGCTLSVEMLWDKSRAELIGVDLANFDQQRDIDSSRMPVVLGNHRGFKDVSQNSLVGVYLDQISLELLFEESGVLMVGLMNRYSESKKCTDSLDDILSTFFFR
ncbi:MAG: hypothetical protein HY482_02025 [Candidatus Wildermuthbacteria bacterium]|nr:hypothetical protein [Candidatus Wildermuthbacteria bacterium]